MSNVKQKLLVLAQKEKDFKKQYENGLVNLKNQLAANISSILVESVAIKEEFIKSIHDKSIPLHERWSLFVNAPDTVKENFKHIPDTKNKGIKYIINQIAEECSPQEFKKFETVDLINEYFDIEEGLDEEELQLYESAIEGFLKENCCSFVFTW